jgi:hypothetical protein
MDAVAGIFIFAVALFLYLLPTIVAVGRGHHNAGPIVVINLLLGWTFLGWIAALVWSITWIPPGNKEIPGGRVPPGQ